MIKNSDTQRLINFRRVGWKKHALRRLFERRITRESVFNALSQFDIIESYSDDKPLPSYLLLGYDGSEPLHMVVAFDEKNDFLWIITVYRPAIAEWDQEFKRRRRL